MNILKISYKGEIIQTRHCWDDNYKNELLRMFRKLYGKRFKECVIEYHKDYRQPKDRQHKKATV